MAKHKVITTNAEIDAALKRAKAHGNDPVARSVELVADLNLLIVKLSNQRRLVIPVEELQGLNKATHKLIQNYKLRGQGTGISFPDLDVDLYVPALIEGVFGNQRWMAQLARKGGGSKTKQTAARNNSIKGGRSKRIAA